MAGVSLAYAQFHRATAGDGSLASCLFGAAGSVDGNVY